MNWIVVKKFPLEKDLTHIAGYLSECKIVHRIYEEAGEQVIATADPRLVGPIAQLLHELERGTLILQHNEAESTPETLNNDDARPPSFYQQIKSVPVTSVLIVLSILGALLVSFDSQYQFVRYLSFQDVYRTSVISLPELLSSAEIWRLITPTFLHFSFMHIFFNSLGMWDLGRRLELLLGKINYVLFFVIAAVLSNLAQFLWHPAGFFGGISGVVYALVGFILVSHKLAPHKLTAVQPAELGFMLFWLVLCMTGALDSFIGGGVANAAHLGGLLVGCAYAFITAKPTSSKV
ncbi:MAG TPA: rhomboid family intramembrane serine protease [Cellvibrio sp.]|nr:rhomboid family intramembrane serine protease [Cellvibrio sp.]